AGVLAIAGTVKEDSAAAIAGLRRLGVEVVVLTGDNARTAAAIARQARVSRVVAGVLRGQKAGEIRRLQAGAARPGWRSTGSAMAPRWPPPTSAWPSAPAPTRPSGPPASRSCPDHWPGWSPPSRCPGRRYATSGRTCSSPCPPTPSASRSPTNAPRRAAVTVVQATDYRQTGVGHDDVLAATNQVPSNNFSPSSSWASCSPVKERLYIPRREPAFAV